MEEVARTHVEHFLASSDDCPVLDCKVGDPCPVSICPACDPPSKVGDPCCATPATSLTS